MLRLAENGLSFSGAGIIPIQRRHDKEFWENLNMMNKSIQQWLTHYGRIEDAGTITPQYAGFINEYEQYYNSKSGTAEEELTEEDISNAVNGSYRIFPGIEVFPEYIYLYTEASTRIIYDEKLIVGYEVRTRGNEFTFDLVVDNCGIVFKAPVNDILNEYLGSIGFNRGLFIRDRNELKEVFRSMRMGANYLRHYIVAVSCTEYYEFLTGTDFLEKYEQLNISCNREDIKFKADKKYILSLLGQYDGFSAKYCSRERFYEIKKSVKEVEIGYNVQISYNTLINFVIWGRRNNELIFSEPSVASLVKKHGSGNKLRSLQFHSNDELKNIFDFMLKYLDVLAAYFDV